MFAFVAREPCKEGRDGPADPGGGKIEKATATEDNDGGGVACIFKTNSALSRSLPTPHSSISTQPHELDLAKSER